MPAELFIALSATVAILAIHAVFLVFHLKKRRKQQDALKVQQAEKMKFHTESIYILLKAMLEGQASYTEVAIRVTALANGVDGQERERLQPFAQLASETAHIPILDAWKALSSKEKQRFDREREEIERRHREQLKALAVEIVS